MGLWTYQLRAILWKNLLLRRYHWLLTTLEILVPLLLFLLVVVLSSLSSKAMKKVDDFTYFNKKNITLGDMDRYDSAIYYSPSKQYFDDLMLRVRGKLGLLKQDIEGTDNEQQLIERTSESTKQFVIAIIFHSAEGSTNLDYTIRIRTKINSMSDKIPEEGIYKRTVEYSPGKDDSTFLSNGFLAVQQAIDTSFIEKEKEKQKDNAPFTTTIEIQELPFPPHKTGSEISQALLFLVPLFTWFSFILIVPVTVKSIVEEKKSGIKELIKMVGVSTWLIWFGWFLYSLLPLMISVIIIIILLKINLLGGPFSLLEYTDVTILFVFFILYISANIIICFYISTWLSKPNVATMIGILIWLVSYIIGIVIMTVTPSVSFFSRMCLMLVPHMAMKFGYEAIAEYEFGEVGVKWSNFHKPAIDGSDEVSMSMVFLMLLIDCILFMLLALYTDAIHPGRYGLAKSIFFPFKNLYHCFRKRDINATDSSESFELENVEKANLPKGIELRNLGKKFGKKTVVNNLSLDIYQDRITVLLGHNGAGKTTTMGMISGMIRKTTGAIIINGVEVKSRSDITKSLGLCPQDNLLFPVLTVKQHLKFFATLKGRNNQECNQEIPYLLQKLNMSSKSNFRSSQLSGGMKRKLSLGMAVVGGSNILILDEPSSGMDPESRRELWDMLHQWRNKKTILITTHFMEEADALGDWIAIMNEGELKCFGTPMYLKKRYETGSNLVLLIKNGKNVKQAAQKIENLLKTQFNFKNAKIKGVNGNEVRFLVPPSNYIRMFEYLEANKGQYDIENISFTSTTLEDVFLSPKVTDHEEGDENIDNELGSIARSQDTNFCLILKALLFKRYRFIIRTWLTYIIAVRIGTLYKMESASREKGTVTSDAHKPNLSYLSVPSSADQCRMPLVFSNVRHEGVVTIIIALIIVIFCIITATQKIDTTSGIGGNSMRMVLNMYDKSTVFISASDRQISKIYGGLVSGQKGEFELVDSVSDGIVKKQEKKSLLYFLNNIIVAAEFSINDEKKNIKAVALYNNYPVYSAPISLSLITNTIAQYKLGKEYSISTKNHHLVIFSEDLVKSSDATNLIIYWVALLPLAYLCFVGFFIYFPYAELSTKFTQIQFMCGVRPIIYWLVTFFADLVVYLIFALLMALIIILSWPTFRGINEFGAYYFILTMYGIAVLPFCYLFGRMNSYAGAYSWFIIISLLSGIIFGVIVIYLQDTSGTAKKTGDILNIIFQIICPQYGLAYWGVKFSKKADQNYNFNHEDEYSRRKTCFFNWNPCCNGESAACDEWKSYMKQLNPEIWYMLLCAVLYFLFNLLLDCYWLKKACNCKRERYSEEGYTEEELEDESTLRVNGIRKYYSGNPVVNNVSLNVTKGQCMGILGVNGAGKTTTFRMLTREVVRDGGDIRINGYDVENIEYLKRLGYCPQQDALNHSLSAREMLHTMAMLRGINDEDVVDQILDIFGLEHIADMKCEHYSGGNKRRLTFADAVIGFPDFILLDEPTTGVDPLSRRKFWTLIKNIRDTSQNSFILTSHSLDECEAVCNDLKIMKAGVIKKEGPIALLKTEVCGFNVMLKLDKNLIDAPPRRGAQGQIATVPELKQYLKNKFPTGQIRDEHSGLIHYYIHTKEKKWSLLFGTFEDLKQRCNLIEDYAISEASLEDVFLTVARHDDSEDEYSTSSGEVRNIPTTTTTTSQLRI